MANKTIATAAAGRQVIVEFKTSATSEIFNLAYAKIVSIHWLTDGVKGKTFTATGVTVEFRSLAREGQATPGVITGKAATSLTIVVAAGKTTTITDPEESMMAAGQDLCRLISSASETGFVALGLTP